MADNRVILSLEERLARSAASQAASPEAAARKVMKIAETCSAVILYRRDIGMIARIENECGPDMPGYDVMRYDGMCQFIEYYLWKCVYKKKMKNTLFRDPSCIKPAWGFTMSNAMIRLALVFIDNAKKADRINRDFSLCLQMTLKDYLDALTDLCVLENGAIDEDRLRHAAAFRKMVLGQYDGSRTLSNALAMIIKDYLVARQAFDYPYHILRMMYALEDYYIREAERGVLYDDEDPDPEYGYEDSAEAENSDMPDVTSEAKDDMDVTEKECILVEPDDEDCETEQGQVVPDEDEYFDPDADRFWEDEYMWDIDPGMYYFDKACEYDDQIPDFEDPDLRPGTYRAQFFIDEELIFDPQEWNGEAVTSDWRVLLEASIDAERMEKAMLDIDAYISMLYLLLVEPFCHLTKYHYESHLEL